MADKREVLLDIVVRCPSIRETMPGEASTVIQIRPFRESTADQVCKRCRRGWFSVETDPEQQYLAGDDPFERLKGATIEGECFAEGVIDNHISYTLDLSDVSINTDPLGIPPSIV